MGLIKRGIVGRRFGLSFDNAQAGGILGSVEGGAIKADPVKQPLGGHARKIMSITNPTFDPIKVQAGMAMSQHFWSWIEESWKGNLQRRSGAIMHLDLDANIVHTMNFYEALITETGIPAADPNAKEPGFMTVTFHPERIEHDLKTSSKWSSPYDKMTQSRFMPSNFRLTLDGLGKIPASKVEAMVVKQPVKPIPTGPNTHPYLEPVGFELPDLVFTVPIGDAEKLFQWHDEFIIKGKNGADNEKTGSLVFLDTTLREELLTISFEGVGIKSLVVSKSQPIGSTEPQTVRVECYMEAIALKYHGAGGA